MIIFAAIVFGLAFLAIASMFLVKLSQVSNRPQVKIRLTPQGSSHYETLWPYFRQKLGIIMSKVWHFILEAKDLKPPSSKAIQEQYEKVKNVFRIRIRSSDDEPQWLPEAAQLTIKPQASQNPEDLYLEAIKKDPNDKQAYEALGRLYLQNKNFQDAVETYEYLIKLVPTKDIYWSNLGLAYYSSGQFQKAASSYEKAISINNKIPTRWINLSLCFDAMDQPAKTVKAITAALELDKMNMNYKMLLADAYVKMSNLVRAEEVLEQVLAFDPTNRQAREKLMKLKI